MERNKKKQLLAVFAIVLAVALIIVSVAALVFASPNSNAKNYDSDLNLSVDADGDCCATSGLNNEEAGENNTSSDKDKFENDQEFLSTSEGEGSNDSNSQAKATSSDAFSSDLGESARSNEDTSHTSVYVTIDGAGHGNVFYTGNFTLNQGANVYDALKATGISINARETQCGVYVAGIGGLAEGSAGGESGWKYAVNGFEPNTACSNYKLKSGDVVKWKFVTKASEAVG